MKLVYLACPYSHPDPEVKHLRHTIADHFAYKLMNQGVFVFSPLTHNIPLVRLGIQNNWNTWQQYDHLMLSKCDTLVVLKLPGWETSPGVSSEIAYARELGLPIEWMEISEEVMESFKISNEPASFPMS